MEAFRAAPAWGDKPVEPPTDLRAMRAILNPGETAVRVWLAKTNEDLTFEKIGGDVVRVLVPRKAVGVVMWTLEEGYSRWDTILELTPEEGQLAPSSTIIRMVVPNGSKLEYDPRNRVTTLSVRMPNERADRLNVAIRAEHFGSSFSDWEPDTVVCESCGGSGIAEMLDEDGDVITCDDCYGDGFVSNDDEDNSYP